MILRLPRLFLFALLLPVNLYASLSLDRVIVYFDADKQPRQDITVTNPDRENLYLQTEVFKVVNPGSIDEERVRITDPADLKLLATPQKAIIAPRTKKIIRLVSLEKPGQKEIVYRVTFKPVVGDLEAKKNAVKVLIAYQALVFVRPKNPKYKVTAQRKAKTIEFTNSGNVNVVLRNGLLCETLKNRSNCSEISESIRLYAGQSWVLKLPTGDKKVEYGLFDGQSEVRQVF